MSGSPKSNRSQVENVRSQASLGTAIDISEQRHVLDAIMRATDAMLVYLDADFNFVAVNPAYAETCHKSPEEMIGKNHFALYPNEENEKIFRHVRDTGEPVSYKDKPFEFPDQPERGVTYWDWSLVPIKGNDGHVTGLVFSLRETTGRKRIEEAARQNEAELREAQRIAHIGSWYWNAKTDTTTGSDELLRIFGLDPASQQMPSLREQKGTLFPNGSWQRLNAAVQEAMRTGVGYELDLEAFRNGERIWITVHSEVVKDSEGHSIGLRGAVHDITHRKHAEDILKRGSKRFALLADSASELLRSSEPRKIVESLCYKVTDHLNCDMFFNYLVDDKAGRLHLNACGGIPPAEVQRIEWLDYGVAVCGCVARLGQRIIAQHIPRTHDPRTDFVKSHGIKAYACYPLLGPLGGVLGTLSFGTRSRETFSEYDLSLMEAVADQVAAAMRRIRDEQALRESERRLHLAQEAASAGSWEWDLRTNENTWSRELWKLYGLKPHCCKPTFDAWLATIHPDDRIKTAHMVQEASGQGTDLKAEWRVCHPDGTVRWLMSRGQPVRDDTGRPVRYIGVVLDITDRKLIEEERQQLLEAERAARTQMERVNRMKDEFLATLSHELRSPLSAILGWTRLLRRGKADDADHALGIIERSADTLTHLIGDMLDMGRIMSGKVRLDLQNVEIRPVVQEVVDSFRPAAEAKHIDLYDYYEKDLGTLRCDPPRIRQVLSNLLSNALKFTPANGRICVRVLRRGDIIKMVVRDTGQGIRKEFLPHLFGKFLQADASTTRKHGGLGLGLAIVKQIVELHGGTVRAGSPGEGKGATFVVILQGVEVPPVPPQELNTGGLNGFEDIDLLDGVRVLLIDDDPNAPDVVRRVLKELGAEVMVASSVTEGESLFMSFHPHLVVSDLSMPGQDGYDLIRRIRTLNHPAAGTTCVALSALTRSEDRERALSAGFDEHLSKLTDPLGIVRVLQGLLRRSKSQQSASVTGGGVNQVGFSCSSKALQGVVTKPIRTN